MLTTVLQISIALVDSVLLAGTAYAMTVNIHFPMNRRRAYIRMIGCFTWTH